MTPEDFDALFDTVSRSAFRFEGLPVYAVDEEDEDLVAWRTGQAMAERSIRTSPWLARIARQTLAGVDWCRVRHVTSPLSWYVRWELVSYVESQAAGEEIRLTADRSAWGGPDFWLFDAGSDGRAHAVLQHYDDDGRPSGFEHVTDRASVARIEFASRALTAAATPLNPWLAEHAAELRAAEAAG